MPRGGLESLTAIDHERRIYDEQQINTQKEFVHQSGLTLAFTQKDVECKTNEVSARSAFMKFGPGAGETRLPKRRT